MSWSDITKITEVKARYFFGVWIFGALLVFLPTEIKDQMGITIPEVVRPWLGFTTLAAFVLWLVLSSLHSLSIVSRWVKARGMKTEILGQLETLSDRERVIFILCLSRNQRTINRNITDSAVNSLKSKGLLIMASQGSVLAMPHTIPTFVWKYIKANQSELFPESLDESEIKRIENAQKNGWMSQ